MNPSSMQAAVMRAMMQQQANAAAPSQQSAMGTSQAQAPAAAPQEGQMVDENGNIIPDPEVAIEWNKLQDWLRKKNLLGSPLLDKNNYGPNLLKQFAKETGSKLTIDDMPAVRRLAKAENDRFINLAKQGKGYIYDANGKLLKNADDVVNRYTELTVKPWENNEKSANPNYFGQWLSRFNIPLTYNEVISNADINKINTKDEFDKSVKSEKKGIVIPYK